MKQPKLGKEEESDSNIAKDLVSFQEDSLIVDDKKVEKASKVPKSVVNKSLSESNYVGSKVRSNPYAYK